MTTMKNTERLANTIKYVLKNTETNMYFHTLIQMHLLIGSQMHLPRN